MACSLYLNKAVKNIFSSSDSLYDTSIHPFVYPLIQHIFVEFLPFQQLGIGWQIKQTRSWPFFCLKTLWVLKINHSQHLLSIYYILSTDTALYIPCLMGSSQPHTELGTSWIRKFAQGHTAILLKVTQEICSRLSRIWTGSVLPQSPCS